MEIELKRGQALVLVGEQGSGKSMLARKIAGKAGAYLETEAARIDSPLALGALLVEEPGTLIVDGFPSGEHTIRKLKSMIATDTTQIEIKNQKPRLVKTPNFIFCVCDKDALNLGTDERRFRIVEL